jgi:hypothetical protein
MATEARSKLQLVMAVDSSYGEGTASDYSAIILGADE